ncbi:MAG: RNA-directed polymerase, partial [Clostridia bacterium]|nr:RNA-directed polymerase [Clostridia bacterium]
TPQGGPLSPLLANIMPDELDWELMRRGHKFARYTEELLVLFYQTHRIKTQIKLQL